MGGDAHSIHGGLDPERTTQLRAFLLYLYDVETASQGLDFSSLSYQLYVYIFICLSLSYTPSSIRTLLLRAIKVFGESSEFVGETAMICGKNFYNALDGI